jgi:hypothetical protein
VIEDYSVSGEDGCIRDIGSLLQLLEPTFHGRHPLDYQGSQIRTSDSRYWRTTTRRAMEFAKKMLAILFGTASKSGI